MLPYSYQFSVNYCYYALIMTIGKKAYLSFHNRIFYWKLPSKLPFLTNLSILHTSQQTLSLFRQYLFTFFFLLCRLYAVGGRDGSSCLKSVECFDPHTNKWTLCAQMSKRRGGVGVTTWNGFLYAIGGHDAPASNLTSRLSDCVER